MTTPEITEAICARLSYGDAAAVTAVSDRNAYLLEKRRALESWASLLDEIVGEKQRASNVVAIRS
jgi:hypothetical protein